MLLSHPIWPTAVVYGPSHHPGGFGTQANPMRTWSIPESGPFMPLGFLDPLRPLHNVYSGVGGYSPAPQMGPTDGVTPLYGMLSVAILPQVQG